MTPVFEYIPVFNDPSKTTLRILSIAGLPSIHTQTASDRGRLYGALVFGGSSYTLTLYNSILRATGTEVLSGTATSLVSPFAMTQLNASGLSGQAQLDAYVSDDSTIVAYPTFAVDQDVMIIAGNCAQLPGFDATYGLAYLHVEAMRQLLASDLPAAVPHLYSTKSGIASFVPGTTGPSLPDLRIMANVDQLRVAQASLVKVLAAREQEHTQEWAEVMKMELDRYGTILKMIAASNILEIEAADAETSSQSLSLGNWGRR